MCAASLPCHANLAFHPHTGLTAHPARPAGDDQAYFFVADNLRSWLQPDVGTVKGVADPSSAVKAAKTARGRPSGLSKALPPRKPSAAEKKALLEELKGLAAELTVANIKVLVHQAGVLERESTRF